jgi:hypothetical protein
MGIAGGPNMIEDGLVFALDAADRNSYPGSGTTWNNIIGSGYNGTFINGISYTSNLNQGILNTDTTSSYISIAGSTSNNDNAWTADNSVGSNIICFEIWVKTLDSSGYIISKPWNGSGQYNMYIQLGGLWRVFVGNDQISSILFANAVNNGVWRQIVVWANTTQIGYYLDGGKYSGSQNHVLTGGVGSAGNSNLPLLLMTLYPYGQGASINAGFTVTPGDIAIFRKYNRVLSASEVLQNYNAQKSRFNL